MPGAVEEDDVADARQIAADERLADAAAPGEERHDDDLDRRRVAVVDRLQERALLERPGHRVHVGEVLRARRTGRPSRSRTLSVGSVERGAPGHGVDRDERCRRGAGPRRRRSAPMPGRDARVRRDDRDEPGALDRARQSRRPRGPATRPGSSGPTAVPCPRRGGGSRRRSPAMPRSSPMATRCDGGGSTTRTSIGRRSPKRDAALPPDRRRRRELGAQRLDGARVGAADGRARRPARRARRTAAASRAGARWAPPASCAGPRTRIICALRPSPRKTMAPPSSRLDGAPATSGWLRSTSSIDEAQRRAGPAANRPRTPARRATG